MGLKTDKSNVGGVPPQPQGSHCWDAHPRLIADLVFTWPRRRSRDCFKNTFPLQRSQQLKRMFQDRLLFFTNFTWFCLLISSFQMFYPFLGCYKPTQIGPRNREGSCPSCEGFGSAEGGLVEVPVVPVAGCSRVSAYVVRHVEDVEATSGI